MTEFDEETEAIEFENLAKIAENIVYLLPGCTDLMVRKAIQEVYRDFCRRSCCLRGRRRFPFDRRTFNIVPMYGGVIDCVSCVRVDGREIRDGIDFRVIKEPMCVVYITNYPVPHHCHGRDLGFIDVETVEYPKVTAEEAPSWFVQRYGDAIVSGAVGRIMGMSGRPWSDAAKAAEENLRYESAVNEARMDFYSENGNGDLGRAISNDELI